MTGAGLGIVVQSAVDAPGLPPPEFLEDCARRVFGDAEGELVIRIVGEAESAELCARYLGKPGPTNVLAFPAGEMLVPAGEPRPLGDLVIAAAVVAREAREQGKSLEAHWGHMVVHGCLHLVGYDHVDEAGAAGMEARERDILAGLGIADPYTTGA